MVTGSEFPAARKWEKDLGVYNIQPQTYKSHGIHAQHV